MYHPHNKTKCQTKYTSEKLLVHSLKHMHKQYTLHQWPPLPIHTHTSQKINHQRRSRKVFSCVKVLSNNHAHWEQQTVIKRGIFQQHHLITTISQALQRLGLSCRCRSATAPGASSRQPLARIVWVRNSHRPITSEVGGSPLLLQILEEVCADLLPLLLLHLWVST